MSAKIVELHPLRRSIRRRRSAAAIAVVLLWAACRPNAKDDAQPAAETSGAAGDEMHESQATAGEVDPDGGDVSWESDDDGQSGDDAASADAGDDGDDDSIGPKFDLGQIPSVDGDASCSKIDFVFAFDNSGSMVAHQDNLLANFSGFIDAIVEDVAASDYHILLLDSDAQPSSTSSSTGNCTSFCDNCLSGSACTCDGEVCGGACEHTLGGGKTGNGVCETAADGRFITARGGPDAVARGFECIARKIGTFGSANELPISAAVEAVTTQASAGACNAGFLREDALLVLTIISDDHRGWAGNDDATAAADAPQRWYDAIIGAKDDPEKVIVLGLFADANLEPADCLDGDNGQPFENPRYLEFIEKFAERGHLASVCETDYAQFLLEGVEVIDTVCDDIPG